MRILHIISSSGIYGAEAVILNLAHILNGTEHSSLLGVFSHSADSNVQLHERAVQEGIESHRIACSGQIDTTAVSRIRGLALSTQANVVHAHGYKADIYVYLALRGTGIPLVSTCHTWYDTDLALRVYGIADRLVLRRFTKVVAVSDDVSRRLREAGIAEEKIQLVRNGVDLRPFDSAIPASRYDGAGERTLTVGLIGRLSWEKGIDLYLKAASLVSRQLADVRFVVAGDGPDREKLERLIDELGIRRNVVLLGRVEDMPSVYASLDVMVSSSRQEGLPMAILEGMATGRPVVATAVGEVPSLVVNGVTGVLVPPEDVPALAAGISRLLQDEAERVQLGSEAKRMVYEQYSAERMAADYLRVYDSAVSSRARQPQRSNFARSPGGPE